jgi:hypothetical protein
MSTRKYVPGYEKKNKLIESQKRGVLNKFVIGNKQNIEDNLQKMMLENLEYKNLISNIASQKARRMIFK